MLQMIKPSARRIPGRSGPCALAALLAVLAAFIWPAPARCDNGTEFGVSDTLKVMGTAGTVPDPNLAVKGFSVFGSTDVLTYISTAPGNVIINGALEVSSDAYITGISTFTGNAFFGSTITVSSIRGLSAPLTGDAPATKAYVDASLLDKCALGSATAADIVAGKSADINCDNFAEVGTLAAQTLDVSTDEVKTGVYAATWLSVVDADLAAGNIRSGVNIFGHAGTFTSGATATAGDILSGLTAGVNGTMITGTLATQTLNPASNNVLAGYYNATTLSAVDADLAAGNIAVSTVVFGVTGTYTSDATATAAQILASQTAYVNGVKLTGTLATQTLNPASNNVLAGYYNATTLSAVDADLAAGNIAVSTVVFGVTGTYTSDATATAAHILASDTAYVNGVKLTGTMPTQTLNPASNNVLAGYYNATTLSAVDADLAAGNIAVSTVVFGVTGTYTSDATATAAQIQASQTAYVNGVKLTGTLVPRALPDTGQTTVYTASDDASYNPANTQLSYTDNADFTITDNRTGLMWKKCSEGQNNDSTCSGTAGTYTWANAITQCEGLTAPGGYTDWRLPNMKELFSIIKYEGTAPFIDQTNFPATVNSTYWTSTTYVPSTTYAMIVTFSNGYVNGNFKTVNDYVRCVRAGP